MIKFEKKESQLTSVVLTPVFVEAGGAGGGAGVLINSIVRAADIFFFSKLIIDETFF